MTALDAVILVDLYTRDNLYIVSRSNSIVAPNRPRTHRTLRNMRLMGPHKEKEKKICVAKKIVNANAVNRRKLYIVL
jgi:hypothetical protein